MDDARTWQKGDSLAAQCQMEKPASACGEPRVRGYPAPCSLVGGGPVCVPGGLAHRATPAPGIPWSTRTRAWPWALSDRPAASAGRWAFLLGSGLALPKPTSLCWPGVGRSGWEGSPLSCPLQGPLLRWLKVNFSEAFIAWIHIKALRVFVESVLRYGLPVNFQAVLLQPHKKSCTKRLREVLNSVFRHLDEVAAASILDASVEIPGLQLSNQDYFPYVYFHIDLSLLD